MKRLTLVLVIVLGLAVVSAEADLNAQDKLGTAFDEHSGTPDSPQHPGSGIIHGAYLPPINNYGTEVLAFNNLVGKDLGILMYFPGFYLAPHEYWWLPYQLENQIP